jgi:hypothetical protein
LNADLAQIVAIELFKVCLNDESIHVISVTNTSPLMGCIPLNSHKTFNVYLTMAQCAEMMAE